MAQSTTALARLNALGDEELDPLLLDVCTSPTWAELVRSARPWADDEAVRAANAAAMAQLDAADLADAMAGHARIGEPRAGDATSQREQSGLQDSDDDVRDALRAANAAYEEKFGQVFLVCATGRTAYMMLDDVRERQDNNAETEQEIVRGELRKINDIRIDRLLTED